MVVVICILSEDVSQMVFIYHKDVVRHSSRTVLTHRSAYGFALGARRAASQMDASCPQFDEEQHIDGLEPDCLQREEIASHPLFPVMSQDAVPASRRSLKRRCDPISLEDIAH